jgi:hypothetical protein
MFDDDNDATEYDPNPWGSRQRLLPLASFVAAPAPITTPPIPPAVTYAAPIAPMTYASIALTTPLMHAASVAGMPVAVPMAQAAPSPFITMRVPALPLHRRRRARLAIPMLGFAAVLLLALAYVLKPPTIAPQAASISNPAVVEPLAMSSAGVVAETVPAAPTPVARAAQKPRVFAKRRQIKIDASITSSPLGQLRPSRR